MSDERHKAAMVLQTALQNIIPLNEQKLRHTSSMLARQYWEKVIASVLYCHFLHTSLVIVFVIFVSVWELLHVLYVLHL